MQQELHKEEYVIWVTLQKNDNYRITKLYENRSIYEVPLHEGISLEMLFSMHQITTCRLIHTSPDTPVISHNTLILLYL